ncbi:hypothetical protein CXB51_002620 [Gossypium anomalum]|uniref:Uncharacterized protein n=1 Tax=Gossypium anomalum TaxID=47600 RepID=A0A8J5Z775_9ROSI|nr:hypothetical protein CXB51_002620 [Gossypium anomalum]
MAAGKKINGFEGGDGMGQRSQASGRSAGGAPEEEWRQL